MVGLGEAWDLARSNVKKAQRRRKKNYDSVSVCPLSETGEGSQVFSSVSRALLYSRTLCEWGRYSPCGSSSTGYY